METKKAEPNSGLGKAIAYLHRHWTELTSFTKIPSAPMSNDLCEQLIKRCVLHRKASMFYKNSHGAAVGDVLMTLIHTATRSGVNPFDYLTELQRHEYALRKNPSAWLPWNYRQTLAELPALKAA
ncbi:MAG: transposase [Acidobacteriota bacterium]